MRDDVTAVMISCQARHAARATTLPQLHALGIHPRVFLDHCRHDPNRRGLHAGEIGNKWVAGEALAHAIPTGKPVLFLEDDIDPAPDFLDGLDAALTTGGITYLYLNESEERMRTIYGDALAERLLARVPTPVRVTRALTSDGLFGAQAVLMPPIVARFVQARLGAVRKAVDAAMQSAIRVKNLPAFVVTPNVVQHRHDRTGREADHSVKRSLSFDCPREVRDGVAA